MHNIGTVPTFKMHNMPGQSPMLAACNFLPHSAPTWSIRWSFIIAMIIFYMSPITLGNRIKKGDAVWDISPDSTLLGATDDDITQDLPT